MKLLEMIVFMIVWKKFRLVAYVVLDSVEHVLMSITVLIIRACYLAHLPSSADARKQWSCPCNLTNSARIHQPKGYIAAMLNRLIIEYPVSARVSADSLGNDRARYST